jgi:hypothetical protein
MVVWTPAYIPTDRLTSWGVLHHPCTVPVYKLLFIRQKTSAVIPLVVITSTVVTPIRLYPLHCTLYCCTLTPTLTRRQSSALVALSPAFVSDFLFQVLQCTLDWLHLSQHCLLTISFRNQQFFSKFIFLLEVSRELPQCSTLNTFFVALNFLIVRCTV